MSSNIGQNFPYASESDSSRAAAVERAFGTFDGLRDTVTKEAIPVPDGTDETADTPQRWWVWVCPEHDFTGRLHVAGYARERHALYTVCDTCGKTFLR